VVLSIQGNLTVYHEKYFAGLKLPEWWKGWRTGYPFYGADHKIWNKRMVVEKEILRRTRFVFGRTDWDRRIALTLAPQAEYFHVDEVIRPRFYGLKWTPHGRRAPVFFTTSSPSIYKGFEVIIDTARLLLANGIEFGWRVAGLKENDPLVRLICLMRKVDDLDALNIRLLGTLTEEAVADQLMNSDAYVQVSHIENSPNSVCEAMLAGVPVIASYAGGTGSLLRDGEHGVLVQDGDPYVLAGAMEELVREPARHGEMAVEARRVARRRHDPPVIVAGMLERYREIIQKNAVIKYE